MIVEKLQPPAYGGFSVCINKKDNEMRKLFAITIALFIAIITTSADARICKLVEDPRDWGVPVGWGNGWKSLFANYQKVAGMAMCSTTNGVINIAGNPSMEAGPGCWCQMTDPVIGRWIFGHWYATNIDCWSRCTTHCSGTVFHNVTFRNAVLTPR